MARQQATTKHGGQRKYGRNKEKCTAYKNAHTRERNKAKKVLQSSGTKACEKYCKLTGVKLPARYWKIVQEEKHG